MGSRNSRTISRTEYNEAIRTYYKLTNGLPDKLSKLCPPVDLFLCAVAYSQMSFRLDVELTPTGKRRFDMLQNPHAAALLAMWAIKGCPGNDNENEARKVQK